MKWKENRGEQIWFIEEGIASWDCKNYSLKITWLVRWARRVGITYRFLFCLGCSSQPSIITINVPVVYMAQEAMILMRAPSITRTIGMGGLKIATSLCRQMATSEASAFSAPKCRDFHIKNRYIGNFKYVSVCILYSVFCILYSLFCILYPVFLLCILSILEFCSSCMQ